MEYQDIYKFHQLKNIPECFKPICAFTSKSLTMLGINHYRREKFKTLYCNARKIELGEV